MKKFLDIIFRMPPAYLRKRVGDFRDVLAYYPFLIDDKNFRNEQVYVLYKTRRILEIIALFYASVCFLISYLYSFHGFWSEISSVTGRYEPTMIAVFLHLMDYAGAFLVLTIIPFFLWFAVHMDFRNTNLFEMAYPDPRLKRIGIPHSFKARVWSAVIMMPIFLFVPMTCMTGPMYVFGYWTGSADYIFIAFLLLVTAVAAQVGSVYTFFLTYIILSYLLFQKICPTIQTNKLK